MATVGGLGQVNYRTMTGAIHKNNNEDNRPKTHLCIQFFEKSEFTLFRVIKGIIPSLVFPTRDGVLLTA